jgi:hypothetical protein
MPSMVTGTMNSGHDQVDYSISIKCLSGAQSAGLMVTSGNTETFAGNVHGYLANAILLRASASKTRVTRGRAR